MSMKLKSILFAALAVAVVSSCGQTAEERIKAYEETHEAMIAEFRQTMDSLSANPAEAEAYYNDFVEKYVEFNLEAAKKNPDNDVAVQVLMNLRGMIEDEQVAEIIDEMPEEMDTWMTVLPASRKGRNRS